MFELERKLVKYTSWPLLLIYGAQRMQSARIADDVCLELYGWSVGWLVSRV